MALIQDLKSNNEKALALLFDQYAAEVYHMAYSLLKEEFESEDVMQEVFIKLWHTRDQLDEQGNIKNLLYVMTKHSCFNRLRTIQSKTTIIDINDALTENCFKTYDDYSSKEILDLEQKVLQKLPDQQRKIYVLSRKEGKSYIEIAEELQVSPNTVRNHMVKALKSMRYFFKKLGYTIFIFF